MLATQHPEVLARDWLPPVVLGHEAEVAEVVRRLDAPRPRAPPPWIVGVAGPRGSGTSTVARRAAREVVDRLRASRDGPIPRWMAARTAGCRGTHGVATALLSALDEGFDGRGFPVAEILAGFLRRIRREGRPLVLVLDDVRVGGPELAPVLRAIGDPDRFLPEGEFGIPPTWLVLAGTPEGISHAEDGLGGTWRIGPLVRVDRYPASALRRIVEDRAERVLGRAAPSGLIARVLERTVEGGAGVDLAVDLLRRALLGPAYRTSPRRTVAGRAVPPVTVETSVVRAIEEASQRTGARVGDVRRFQAEYARATGASPLPATTLWRRFVRLEQAGYIRREVRPGGEGGTRSVVRLMAPVDEWVIAPDPREGSRPTDGSWLASDGAPPTGGSRTEGSPLAPGLWAPEDEAG
jgi:hypothetical protein